MRRLTVTVQREGTADFVQSYALPEEVRLPGSLTIEDQERGSGPVVVRVRLEGVTNQSYFIERSARLSFVKERTKVLRLTLARACLDTSCVDGFTCDGGQCVSEEVDGSTLPDVGPDPLLPDGMAGQAGAGPAGAGGEGGVSGAAGQGGLAGQGGTQAGAGQSGSSGESGASGQGGGQAGTEPGGAAGEGGAGQGGQAGAGQGGSSGSTLADDWQTVGAMLRVEETFAVRQMAVRDDTLFFTYLTYTLMDGGVRSIPVHAQTYSEKVDLTLAVAPVGIAVHQDQVFYTDVASDGSLYRFDLGSGQSNKLTGVTNPFALALDASQKTLYLSSGTAIYPLVIETNQIGKEVVTDGEIITGIGVPIGAPYDLVYTTSMRVYGVKGGVPTQLDEVPEGGLTMSVSGDRLVYGSPQGTLRICDLSAGCQPYTITSPVFQQIDALVLTSSRLFVAGKDGNNKEGVFTLAPK